MKLASALAIATAMTIASTTPVAAQDGIPGPEQDSYIWLEEARSDKALDWVRAENERTMELLAGDPRYDAVKAEALAIHDSEDRIPYVTIRPDGLYNFWQDKQNPRGLVRRTTLKATAPTTRNGKPCLTSMRWPRPKGANGCTRARPACRPKIAYA